MPSITSTSLYFPYPLTTVLPPLLTLTYPPSTLSQTPVTILPNSTLHLPNPGTIRTSLNLVDPVVDEILCIEERGVKWTRGGEKWEMKVEEVGMGGCVVHIVVDAEIPSLILENHLSVYLRHLSSSETDYDYDYDSSQPKDYGDLISGEKKKELKVGEEYVEERGKGMLGGFRNSFTALH